MNDCDGALAVADAGAAVVRRCFGTTLPRREKGEGDFATHADLEAENAMLAGRHTHVDPIPTLRDRGAPVQGQARLYSQLAIPAPWASPECDIGILEPPLVHGTGSAPQ